MRYPSLYDSGSETLLAFGEYAPFATSSTIVLDVNGRIAALINGPVPSQRTLDDLVREL